MDGIVVTMNPNKESMSHPPYNDNPARTTTRLFIPAALSMSACEEQINADVLMQRLLPCGANIRLPYLHPCGPPQSRTDRHLCSPCTSAQFLTNLIAWKEENSSIIFMQSLYHKSENVNLVASLALPSLMSHVLNKSHALLANDAKNVRASKHRSHYLFMYDGNSKKPPERFTTSSCLCLIRPLQARETLDAAASWPL